jgi:hypothetical protein
VASGYALPVPDPLIETAKFYRVSKLKVDRPEPDEEAPQSPSHGVLPALEVHRKRRHGALRTFEAKCASCIWGCRMPVEMIVDQWNPSQRRYRTEIFCYGPFLPTLRAGPARTVPGRYGMSFTEEDWVDDEATSHRQLDE